MVEILFVLAALGGFAGSIGGVLWNGYEGLLMGGSIGLVASVLCWTLVYGLSSVNRPQRLDAPRNESWFVDRVHKEHLHE